MGKRYLDRDLNRIWTDEANEILDRELVERQSLTLAIETEISKTHEKVVLLDLHTTTADGGIFTFPDGSLAGIELGKNMGAPVILEMMNLLPGTCMEYFSNKFGERLTSLAFEGGQHRDPTSVNRMIAAIVSCLRAMKCVSPQHIEHQHDHILQHYSAGLPEVSRVTYRHGIDESDSYQMLKGFSNFDHVEKGDQLATDKDGVVLAPKSGMLLMPHYQQQGEDGFFIIEKETER